MRFTSSPPPYLGMVRLPGMVLLATCLLLACMPTPTSSAATNLVIVYDHIGPPLTMYATWDDDIDPPQTYKIHVRDIPGRTSYFVFGITTKYLLLDAAAQAQMHPEGSPSISLVVSRTQTYALQITGETDGSLISDTVGYLLDSCGPPVGPIVCDVTDETSVDQYSPITIAPAGCQSTQVSGKVRIYFDDPTDSGYNDGTPVSFLSFVFQWSLDATFTTNVFEETCTNAPVPPTIVAGDVCNFDYQIAQIPRSGRIYAGTYFIRIAAGTTVGVGAFTEAVSVVQGPAPPPTICPAGYYENDYACLPCPAGTSSPVETYDITGCICIEGYTAESNGVACTACAAATWKNVAGNTTCIACPVGSDSPEGSQNIQDCTCFEGYILTP